MSKVGGGQGARGWQVGPSHCTAESERTHWQSARVTAQSLVGMLGKIPGFSFLISTLGFLLLGQRVYAIRVLTGAGVFRCPTLLLQNSLGCPSGYKKANGPERMSRG